MSSRLSPFADSCCIEILESRIAPAAVFDSATTAHYTDVDGDLVKIVFSKPILTQANIGSVLQTSVQGGGDILAAINLGALASPQSASGTNLTITAARTALGGDGLANVGRITATNIDLGVVSIRGDLRTITAGDGDPAVGVKSLSVQSMGAVFSGGALNESDINGTLGSLKVVSDIQRAYLLVSGNIGTINVGGSLKNTLAFSQEGIINCTGQMGAVTIGHDIGARVGGSGALKSGLGIKSVSVGGSIFGGFILGTTDVDR